MIENIDKSSDEKVFRSDMDDGGRCLLDVINDPQLFQSFLDNSNSNNSSGRKDDLSIKIENTSSATKEIKAKKSIVATKSNPVSSSEMSNGKQSAVVSGGSTFSTGLIIDSKQALSVIPNSVGMMPLSITNSLAANGQSINIQQSLSGMNQAAALGSNSNAIRAPTSAVFPQAQFQIGPRSMTVLPQQLIMPGMPLAQPGIPQILLTSRPPNPSPSIQPGQVLQIIQTSQGTQILPANATTSIQPIVTTTATTSSGKSSSSNSRSNKQILPKPLSSSVSSTPSKSNSQASNNIKLIPQQNGTTTFNSQPINASTNLGSTPQFVIGSSPQHTGIITGPQGTFLVNNVLQNIGSQQFLFQGNVQNPVQLAIRPQAPLFVNNNSLTNDQANLSIALSNNGQVSNKSQSSANQSQTFVLSNPTAPPVSSASNLLMSSNIRANTPNIFIRPQFIGAQQTSQPQFLQLQTANGPVLVALNSSQVAPQTILGPQAAPNVQPSTIQIGNTVFSLAANPSLNLPQTILTQPQDSSSITNTSMIQPNIATSISTSSPLIINSPSSLLTKTRPIVSPSNIHVVGQQSPKTNSSKGVNLADLLKETGILSDFSPPTSPKNSALNSDLSTHQGSVSTGVDVAQPVANQSPQSTVLMVPSGLNSSQNLLVTQNSATPQIRISIASDGTLMLLPQNTNVLTSNQVQITSNLSSKSDFSNSQKDSSGIGSSQPSPDSTTPSIDTTTTSSPSTSVPQTVSSLINHVNDKKVIQSLSNSLSNENSSFKFVYDKPVTSTAVVETNLTPFIVKTSACEQNQTASTMPSTTIANYSNMSLNTSALSVFSSKNSASCDTQNVTTGSENIHLTAPNSCTSQKSLPDPVNLLPASNVQLFTSIARSSNVTLADLNGIALLQVNSNNKEFMNRLDTQLKSLSTLKSPSLQQKELTQELINIQQKLLQPPSVGLTVQINLSPQAQQLLQLCKSLTGSQQNMALGSSQLGNIILSNNSTNKDNLQFLINQNQLTPNSIQLVNTPLVNTSLGLLPPPSLAVDSQGNPTSKSNPTSLLLPKDTANKININVPLNQIRIDPGKSRTNVLKAIQQQCNADQNAALHPDCKTPFRSRDDACKRLLRYHVFNINNAWSKTTIEKFDKLYEDVSEIMLQKKFELFNKYRYLLLKQGMRASSSCEHVMLDRMFVQDETISLKNDQEFVASGKLLDLPPLPDSWSKLKLEKESSSLKRKYSIEDFDDEFDHNQAEKEEITDICNMLEEEKSILNGDLNNDENALPNILPDHSQLNPHGNQDIASVDDLIDQLNSQDDAASSNQHLLTTDHQSFLDSLDNVPLNHNGFLDQTSNSLNMVTDDLETLYSDIQSDDQLNQTTANLPWSASMNCSSVSNSIHNNLLENSNEDPTARISWNSQYSVAEAEAAVAVQSIINSNEETNLSVDLSGIEDLDVDNSVNMGVDNSVNFDDVIAEGDGDEDSSFLDSDSIGQQQGFDVQMQFAINSITLQSPTGLGSMSTSSQSTNYSSHQSYQYSTSNNTSTSYNNLPYHMSSHQMMPNNMRSNNMMPYQSSVPDTMLDEAVKSILS